MKVPCDCSSWRFIESYTLSFSVNGKPVVAQNTSPKCIFLLSPDFRCSLLMADPGCEDGAASGADPVINVWVVQNTSPSSGGSYKCRNDVLLCSLADLVQIVREVSEKKQGGKRQKTRKEHWCQNIGVKTLVSEH